MNEPIYAMQYSNGFWLIRAWPTGRLVGNLA
jgi:hypothetical protein